MRRERRRNRLLYPSNGRIRTATKAIWTRSLEAELAGIARFGVALRSLAKVECEMTALPASPAAGISKKSPRGLPGGLQKHLHPKGDRR
jgi:hypothetical protein